MTKILVVGDPHAKVSSLDLFKTFETKLCDLIKQIRPDAIVILGDLANDFERVHVLALNAIANFFQAVRIAMDHGRVGLGLPIYYVVGNHDCINNRWFLSDDHAFHAFKWHIDEDLYIIDRPVVKQIGYKKNFMLCPYVQPGRFAEALATVPDWWDKSVRAVFCHQEFRDVQLGPIKSTIGDVWPDAAPPAISGHIHEHQWLKPNICYVGSPGQVNDGDSAAKTVSLFDFDDTGYTEQQISLGLPHRLTVTVTVEQAKEYVVPEAARVRLYVTGTTEELAAFKNSNHYKRLSEQAKVIVKPTDPTQVRRNQKGRGFMELLQESAEREGKLVQDALSEAIRNANQTA